MVITKIGSIPPLKMQRETYQRTKGASKRCKKLDLKLFSNMRMEVESKEAN